MMSDASPRTLRDLQRWAENAPLGTLIPADSLAAMLGGIGDGDDRLADLTVEQVGAELNRAPSTIRGWLGSGQLRGYRLHHREWRIAPAAVREYLEGQKNGRGTASAPQRNGKAADLAAWRQTLVPNRDQGQARQ